MFKNGPAAMKRNTKFCNVCYIRLSGPCGYHPPFRSTSDFFHMHEISNIKKLAM